MSCKPVTYLPHCNSDSNNVITVISKDWLSYYYCRCLLVYVPVIYGFGPLNGSVKLGDFLFGSLRLPRALAVLMVGASLAVSGAVMQALFENPLAEPGLLGVANGAGVALVMAVLLGHGLLPIWFLSACAIAGALLMTMLLLGFARRRLLTNARLLLVGVALGIVCSAIMTWAVYFSTSLDLRQLMYWMMGGFSGIDWRHQGWCWHCYLSSFGSVAKGMYLILCHWVSNKLSN